jgi:outer membrane protein assembly factor BamD (BamD/ComL family)
MSQPPNRAGLVLAAWCLLAAGCASIEGGGYASTLQAATAIRAQSPEDEFEDDETKKKDPLFGRLFEDLGELFKPNPDAQRAADEFRQADELFVSKQYGQALSKYKKAALYGRRAAIEQDALFMIAECYFFGDEYPDAIEAYEDLLARYPNTRHFDKVMQRLFVVARYWQDLQRARPRMTLNPNFTDASRPLFDTTGQSIKAYKTIWTHDSTGPLADDAIMLVANSYFENNRWEEASFFYDQLRTDYPQSPHLIKAFLLGFKAKLEAYQGPGYDRTPLDEAEELIEVLLAQFSDQLGEERVRILEARSQVRALQAEREWEMAQYFARGKHYGGARSYLQNLIDKYPETQFADLARKRLQELQGLPDTPPDRFGWVLKFIPQRNTLPKPISKPSVAQGRQALPTE